LVDCCRKWPPEAAIAGKVCFVDRPMPVGDPFRSFALLERGRPRLASMTTRPWRQVLPASGQRPHRLPSAPTPSTPS
jgi:hypothetical protein